MGTLKPNFLNVVDNLIETDSLYAFDKMLVPNRVFNLLLDNVEKSGNSLLAKNFDYLLYIVNTIYRRYQIAFNMAKKYHWSIDLSKWAVPLYSKIYNTLLGTNYKEYVDLLIEWNIIGRSDSYVKGNGGNIKGRCKHFWFTPDLLSYVYTYFDTKYKEESGDIKKRQGGVRVLKVSHPSLYKRLANHAELVKSEQLSIPLIKELHDDLQHFSINVEESEAILDNLIAENKIPPERKIEEMHKVTMFNSYSEDPYALYCKRDPYGRVHTNVTQMKKEVRKNCIYCDGQRTVGIDIKSSQGAFLYKILDNYIKFFDNGEHIVNSYIRNCETTYRPYWNSYDNLVSVFDCYKYELSNLNTLLIHGCLYEFFMRRLNDNYCMNCTRAEVKKEFLTCLFCGPYYSKRKHRLVEYIRCIWKEEFPNLYKAIEIIKKGNYAALAHDLQRTESNLVFRHVYRRIRNELKCPVCTVHDSIIVAEQYAERAQAIFNECLNELEIPTFTELELMESKANYYFERS